MMDGRDTPQLLNFNLMMFWSMKKLELNEMQIG